MASGQRPGSKLRVELLGGLRVSVGRRRIPDTEWRLRKPAGLVKLLALARGHRMHREQVMDLLWPGLDPQAAGANLRKAVHHARRVLDSEEGTRYLVSTLDTLSFSSDVWVDVDAFEASASEARRTGDAAAYERAVELYAGELLPEDRYEDWAIPRREELRADFLALLVEQAALLEARAGLDAAAAALRRAVEIDPINEDAHVGLMRLYALAGRRHEAMVQFEQLRDTLRRELAADPDVTAQELYEEIKAGEGREPALTADLWERIGELRVRSGDAGGAVVAFRSALAGTETERDRLRRARLHRMAAKAALMLHDASAAEPEIVAAEELLASGDDAERGRLLGVIANWHWERGELEKAQEAAESSLELAERFGDGNDTVAANEALAIVFHIRGSWREGLHVEIERLGAAADEDPQLARVFDLHHCIGQYHLYGDRLFEDVEGYARHTLKLASKAGARRAEAFAWCLLGESLLLRGYWDESGSCLTRSAEIHAELGNPTVALPWQRMAELAACLGDWEGADELLKRGMSIATVSPMASHGWGRLYATAAFEAMERGEPAIAVRAVRSASAAAVRYGDCPTCSALLHPIAAEAFAALGEADRAAEHAAAADRVAGFFQSAGWRAMAETALGSVALARRDTAGARARFLGAADLYDRARQPFWAARSRLQAGTAGSDGSLDRTLLEDAVATFSRLGAARSEERARAALGAL